MRKQWRCTVGVLCRFYKVRINFHISFLHCQMLIISERIAIWAICRFRDRFRSPMWLWTSLRRNGSNWTPHSGSFTWTWCWRITAIYSQWVSTAFSAAPCRPSICVLAHLPKILRFWITTMWLWSAASGVKAERQWRRWSSTFFIWGISEV